MNLEGQQIGFWSIGKTFMKSGRRYYYCVCLSCGSKKEVRSDSLLSGGSKACKPCVLEKHNKQSGTHRASKSRLYKMWFGMRRRIKDKNKNYVLIGVKVCDDWQRFENFRDWALVNGYRDDLTIERKNPLGNYEPDNCRFATNKEQQANKLNTIRLQDGSMAWITAQSNGITRSAFDKRLKMGWSVEKACTEKLRAY